MLGGWCLAFGVFKVFIVIGCWLLVVIPRLLFVVCCLFAGGRWLLLLCVSCWTAFYTCVFGCFVLFCFGCLLVR